MINETVIQARITALETELAAYVMQANTNIQTYQAVIGELKRLIVVENVPKTEYVAEISGV